MRLHDAQALWLEESNQSGEQHRVQLLSEKDLVFNGYARTFPPEPARAGQEKIPPLLHKEPPMCMARRGGHEQSC